MQVYEYVMASGVRFTGCSVHFVSPEMDEGPIIAQPEATAEAVAAAVLEQEHVLYPQALRLLAEGRLSIDEQRVRVTGSYDGRSAN
ncbi:MAG: formyltransferase family protein [Ferrovibrio sp.]|uniref:formyltransferase family protein n=1 Tax=Ferrovibrio sp. TaxID=1917215 RepID=UPI002624B7D2|nr:formyltransferase family protein [Ferrovibrio sp.]MCW0235197.1 formyltransferase family protein [Ferrovibrio sp.]